MGMPLIPSSHGKAVIKKSWKGKTPHIGIKQLDKMRSHATVKSMKGRGFQPGTKFASTRRQQNYSCQNAIPLTGLGDPREGTWISFNSGKGSIGFA